MGEQTTEATKTYACAKCGHSGHEPVPLAGGWCCERCRYMVRVFDAPAPTDLPQRLRSALGPGAIGHLAGVRELCCAAADEIERLREIEGPYKLLIAQVGEIMEARQKDWRETHRLQGEVAHLKRIVAGPMTIEGASLRESLRSEMIKLGFQMAEQVDRQRVLLARALSVITSAIMAGMPVTDEVAAVRNDIAGGQA